MTIEPPDGNSTVVSFLRVRKPGTGASKIVICVDVSISVTSVAMRNWMRPWREDHRREIQRDAVGLLNDRGRANVAGCSFRR